MSEEKQNNVWANRLEQLEQLPVAAWSKDAAWDTLYNRLQEKPRRRKAFWYIPAAACLLLAVLITWLMWPGKETAPVTNASPQKTTVGRTAQPVITKDINVNTNKTQAVVQAKQEKNISHKESKRIVTSQTVKYSLPVDIKAQEEPVVSMIPSAVPVTAPAIVITVAPKKKLKMVHLNEVGNPAEEEGKMAKFENWHSFQVKFNSPDVFAVPSDKNINPSNRADGLTIKASSKN